MSAAALRRQALGQLWTLDPGEDDRGYFPHPDQVELFHDGSPVDADHPPVENSVESRGEDRVLSAREISSDGTRTSRAPADGNIRAGLALKFPALAERDHRDLPIDSIGTNDFTEICADVLQAVFGQTSAPIKRIAQVANVNEKTAKNWWERKNPPGPIHMLRLMAHVPEFQGEMRRLAAMESALDPELERAMADMARLLQRGNGR